VIRHIRKTIALAHTLLMGLPTAFGQQSVASQINAIPAGAKMELRLKNGEKTRGTKGTVSSTGLTLVDSRAARQIAIDDVASVRQLKSHTTRNVLIVAGIGVAALGITAGIIFRCGGLGCGKAF
jgi:hypothetical protein